MRRQQWPAMFSGDRLALRQADGRVSVWDLAQQRLALRSARTRFNFAWSDDTERLLTWSADDSVDVLGCALGPIDRTHRRSRRSGQRRRDGPVGSC